MNHSVTFQSEASCPQVIVVWSGELKSDSEQPEIRLLDRDLAVLLAIQPEGKLAMSLKTEERHTLRSYGTTYLRRLFNKKVLTADNNPIYEESAKLATALAIHTSRRLDRDMSNRGRNVTRWAKDEAESSEQHHSIEVELWRLLGCAGIIFHGVFLPSNEISEYVRYLSCTALDAEAVPLSWQSVLDTSSLPDLKRSGARIPWKELIKHMCYLAEIGFLLACVENINGCEDTTFLISDHYYVRFSTVCKQIKKVNYNIKIRGRLYVYDVFYGIEKSLTTSTFEKRDNNVTVSTSWYKMGRYRDGLVLVRRGVSRHVDRKG